MYCLMLRPVPSDVRAKLASIIRKPSVYAGKNEPTAVYDAFVRRLSIEKPPFVLFLACFSKISPNFMGFPLISARIFPISQTTAGASYRHSRAEAC